MDINVAQLTIALVLGVLVGVGILLIGMWMDKQREKSWHRELENLERSEPAVEDVSSVMHEILRKLRWHRP